VRLLASTIVFCVLIAVGPAAASAPSQTNRARLDNTIRYLQEAQNPDGGFGGTSGRESGQGFSAWVALALAAAGINPRCQARPGGVDAYGFLVDHFHKGLEEEIPYPSIPTTAFERELMVVDASGADPHDFAGYDLVKEILARELPDGSFPYVPEGRGEINDTIFAVVALDPIQEPEAQAAIQRAANWLISEQDDDGGWSFEVKGRRTEADMTGAAIQALRAAGRSDTEAERDGLQYLRAMQSSDGGFPEFPGEAESNVASTAWAAQGIWSAVQDPEAWVEGGNDPLSYMASLQQSDGHIRWKASEDTNGVWMTAYVAPAFAGQAWPIPASPCDTKQPTAPTQSGQGEGNQSGGGVIAGGGGRGAPLFSRPKPQSKGRTPGGARQVRRNRYAIDHSETKRGENAEQPTITATSEVRRKHDEAPAEARENDGGEGAGSSSARGGRPQSSGSEVTGTLVGGGAPGYGAPGLHGAGAGGDGTSGLAIAIGAAALLFGFGGFQLERSRRVVLP
jgi:Squalene-hopene cyclase C-terminal domain/Prenyltransferase and squalene oxidase repeat